MMKEATNNKIAESDAIALLSENLKQMTERLEELEKDNKRLKRMVRKLNLSVAFSSNLSEVYARMIDIKTLENGNL
jgi:uncharacterized protein (UPF0335 family)